MSDLLMTRRVVFSECGLFRYLLEHDFGGSGPVISLGMVNPSLADGQKNDQTMSKVDGFALRLGASKVIVWNPFARIAKDIRDLRHVDDPIGPENDAHIAQAIQGAESISLPGDRCRSSRSHCEAGGVLSWTFSCKPVPSRCAGGPRWTVSRATR